MNAAVASAPTMRRVQRDAAPRLGSRFHPSALILRALESIPGA